MKNFKDICRLSQPALKTYMQEYLRSLQYNVINEDGFLYAKGTVPVMLVAHMDTVHKLPCYEITEVHGRLSSPQGIGGDDRCGVFMIMNIVKELHCSVLLCEEEEKGGIGAQKFTNATYTVPASDGKENKEKYVDHLDVNYMIEFDRRGHKNVVFYSCDNKDFTKFITETTGFKQENGSFSDISLVAPAAKIAAVNMSCGYYQAHTPSEHVVYAEMMETIETAKKLINTKSDAFKYVAKKFEPSKWDDFYWSDVRGSNNHGYTQQKLSGFGASTSKKNKKKKNDFSLELTLELEIVYLDFNNQEVIDVTNGSTKAECWAKFFMANPDISYSMIVDWSFC